MKGFERRGSNGGKIDSFGFLRRIEGVAENQMKSLNISSAYAVLGAHAALNKTMIDSNRR